MSQQCTMCIESPTPVALKLRLKAKTGVRRCPGQILLLSRGDQVSMSWKLIGQEGPNLLPHWMTPDNKINPTLILMSWVKYMLHFYSNDMTYAINITTSMASFKNTRKVFIRSYCIVFKLLENKCYVLVSLLYSTCMKWRIYKGKQFNYEYEEE